MLTYIAATQRELKKINTKMKEKPYNLRKNEKTNMKRESEQEDIIITKADKGGAVDIVLVKNYIKNLNYN